MKRFFAILSFVPAVISGFLYSVNGGIALFHLVWLMPISGSIAGILAKPVLFAGHMGVTALSLLIAQIIESRIPSPSAILLVTVLAGILNLLGFGVGAFGRHVFRGSAGHRIGAGIAAFLLLAVLFVPVNAIYGNPVSALIAKRQLDSCMETHVDPARYTVEDFGYDWYDGHYYYRLTDAATGESKNLTLYEHKDTIYFSGTNRTYENVWN